MQPLSSEVDHSVGDVKRKHFLRLMSQLCITSATLFPLPETFTGGCNFANRASKQKGAVPLIPLHGINRIQLI